MIPKAIHYCWFGGKPLPRSAQRCIASWHKFFPDYEIKEWNEGNFDVNIIPYTAEAYAAKKYAFVSDYARMWILYRYGGLYFDTDVMVIRPFNDILARGSFMGFEIDPASSLGVGVNPGLGVGVNPGLGLYKEILDRYAQLHFLTPQGANNCSIGIVKITTDALRTHGLSVTPGIQHVAGVWVYPAEYFNPLDDATGRLHLTANTHSIHLYTKTWADHYGPFRIWATRWAHRLFGVDSLAWLKRLVGK